MKYKAPTEWQQEVLNIPDNMNLALLGGRGGGKSTALEFLTLRHCEKYGEKARTLIIRSTYKSLQNFWENITALFAEIIPGCSMNKADHVIRTPTGAVVTLSNFEDERDVRKLQGQEANLLIIDEITNFVSIPRILKLRANLRGTSDVPIRLIYAGNPGGPLHATMARLFVTNRTPWSPFVLEDGSEWVYCPSTYRDNSAIDREPYAKLILQSAGGDRALADAWLDNSWSALGGSFFADVWGDHLLIDDPPEFKAPREWHSRVSLDWGMTAPSVALLGLQPREIRHDSYFQDVGVPYTIRKDRGWWSSLPPGSWVIIDEVHSARSDDPSLGKGWPPQMLAEEVIAACKRWNVKQSGVCDDARGLQGDTLIEQFRKWSLYFEKPTKDRISGWVKLKSMMAATRDVTAKSPRADYSAPRLYISKRCKLTIETLPMLPRDDVRMEDVDTRANDHAADALRYLVNSQTHYVGIATRSGL